MRVVAFLSAYPLIRQQRGANIIQITSVHPQRQSIPFCVGKAQSPRAEPVTSAVFPVKSNKAVMLFPHLFNLYDDYPF